MLDTVIVSDLHYGDKRCNLDAVGMLFDSIKEAEMLIIAGDLLDSWWTSTWDFNALRAVLGRLHTERRVIIQGNHDPENLGELLADNDIGGVADYVVVHGKNGDYAVVHGHSYDYYLAQYSWLVRMGFWLQKFCITKFNVDFSLLRKFSVSARNRSWYFKRYLSDSLRSMRQDYAGKAGVICGHTHYPLYLNMDGGFEYINSGDVLESFTYVVVDADGNISLRGFYPEAAL